MLEAQGIHYLGVAFPAGRKGPFRLVHHAGGSRDACEPVRPYIEAIAAKCRMSQLRPYRPEGGTLREKWSTMALNTLTMQLIAESYLL